MGFLEYIQNLAKESTGTVGAAASGQWEDMPINGTEFYRKMGNKSRNKSIMWDDFSTPKDKSKLDPNKMFAMPKDKLPKSIRPVASFEEWLLNENTVSQMVKQLPPELYQYTVSIYSHYMNFLRQVDVTKHDMVLKWVTYNAWKSLQWKIQDYQKDNPTQKNNFIERAGMICRQLNGFRDFLTNLLNNQYEIAKSKFNNPGYKIENIEKDSEDWHEKLKLQTRSGADPGRRVDIEGMPQGYYWVSLDRRYCSKEASAMGHCGNQGGSDNDNIYSMRDSRGIPHLTFIVNDGRLGESKGYGNAKPEPKYHPQIVAFLLGKDKGRPIVNFIKGGGYAPQNNFQFTDLTKEEQEKVLAVKPHIVDWGKYVTYKSKGKKVGLKSYIEKEIGSKIVSVKNGTVLYKKFDHIDDLTKWLKEETNSDLKSLPDFETISDYFDYYPNLDDSISNFEQEANDKNKELANQIVEKIKSNYLKDQGEDFDEEPDFDLEWAAQNNDELESALRQAASDGYRAGAESDAYESIVNHFNRLEDEEKYGFYIVRAKEKKKDKYESWLLTISLNDLGKLLENEDIGHIDSMIKFEYEPPYNGFSGFDENAYNDYLADRLHDALSSLE